MSHPYEPLADLLDGTLDADARAGVDAHLASCEDCRTDLAAAAAGREAARRLPTVEPPDDLRDRTAAAVGGGGPAPAASRWYRWAGVAAAAVVVGVVALSLPDVGGGDRSAEAPANGPASGASEASLDAAAGSAVVEVSGQDYGETDLARLAEDAVSFRAEATLSAPDAAAADADAAAACVRRAFEEQPTGRLVRLIRARFDGAPAYLAVYLEGPGAGEAPDTAVVWVASAETCSVLSFAQARI